ncbi:STAS domain-containing protein [Actinomadura roseirufa]|uniref:STAS domain-containing protein n=1 Tax=Actinomadura roseirufa TaxID=2094049 RepID=UPI00104114C5|nr:STAS domain-containing protein [Actinomadura roseirufa]
MGVHAATLSTGPPPLVTTVMRVTGGTVHIDVAGELDIATAVTFRVALGRVFREHGARVVVDASALTFCDARGVAAIVSTGEQAERRGGSLTLTGVRPQMAKILRLTGLYAKFVPLAVTAPPR